jgi:hypothetical protein
MQHAWGEEEWIQGFSGIARKKEGTRKTWIKVGG